jgi:hypothetical protein
MEGRNLSWVLVRIETATNGAGFCRHPVFVKLRDFEKRLCRPYDAGWLERTGWNARAPKFAASLVKVLCTNHLHYFDIDPGQQVAGGLVPGRPLPAFLITMAANSARDFIPWEMH